MENKTITQLRAHCDSILNGDNKMTAQEKETLLILIKKSVSPSRELTMATSEEEAYGSPSFENTTDEMWESSSSKLSESCATLAQALSDMIEVALIADMKKNNLTDVRKLEGLGDSVKDSLSDLSSSFNLPPDIAFKPALLGSFILSQVEDPIEAVLQVTNCLKVGESIIENATKMALSSLYLKQMLTEK